MLFSFWFRIPPFIAAALASLSLASAAPGPDWWSQRELTNGQPADDFAAANLGQLKYITGKAVVELDAHLPGGAGAELHNVIAAWNAVPAPGVVRDDYTVLNQGQLKNIAQKIYDRLHAAGWHGLPLAAGQSYPWTSSPTDDDAYAVVNVGQLKYIFSFNVVATRAIALHVASPFTTADHTTLRVRVTVPDGVAITSIRLNGQALSLSLLQDGLLVVDASLLMGVNAFTVTVTDAQGHSYSSSVQVTRVSGVSGPSLTFTRPAANAALTAKTVDVYGTWSGDVPLRTVTVNDRQAVFTSDTWSVQAIPLVNGSNTLSVTATDLAGRTAVLTRSITTSYVSDAPSPVTLMASPNEGPAPLTVTFTAQLNVPGTVQRVDYYFHGRGQPTATGTTFAPKTYVFSSPGDYYPTVTVTLTDGTQYSSGGLGTPLADRLHIHVTGGGDGPPAVWAAFGAALAVQDVEAASAYLGTEKAAKWKRFLAIGGAASGKKIYDDLANLEEIVSFENVAQYRAAVNTPFGRVMFPVNFIKEENAWKIDEF
jgi:hypothetical protein